jgi:hypothetical protein
MDLLIGFGVFAAGVVAGAWLYRRGFREGYRLGRMQEDGQIGDPFTLEFSPAIEQTETE